MEDWRLRVALPHERHGPPLLDALRSRTLEREVAERIGPKLIVSRDGPEIFIYAGSEDAARAAEELARAVLAEHGWSAEVELTRWHPGSETWEDPSSPLPESEEAARAEHAQLMEREAAEARARGEADWEVRVELPSHAQAVELSRALEAEGMPHVRRWRYLVVGADNEDDAHALAQRLGADVPEGAEVTVEGTGAAVERGLPPNPFAIFGGLGA